jgi:hypothetical protein
LKRKNLVKKRKTKIKIKTRTKTKRKIKTRIRVRRKKYTNHKFVKLKERGKKTRIFKLPTRQEDKG